MKSEKQLPRGIRNNNPLNIRIGNNWYGERKQQTDSIFEQFISMDWGIRAAFILLYNYYAKYGCNTIERIIRWAPRNENNTENYVRTVSMLTGIRKDAVLIPSQAVFTAILMAMAEVENGGKYLSLKDVKTGWALTPMSTCKSPELI